MPRIPEVGDVFQRNSIRRDPRNPAYIIIVERVFPEKETFYCRKLKNEDLATHEELVWGIGDYEKYFTRLK